MNSASLMMLAFVLYLFAAVCCGAVLFLRAPAVPGYPSGGLSAPAKNPSRGVTRWSRPLLMGGIIVQFFAIGLWCATTHRSPFASAYGTLTITAWAVALAFAAVDFRGRMPALGAIALSVACLMLFFGVLQAQNPGAVSPVLGKEQVTLHVLTIVASFGLFALAFGCAALYLLQSRLLKQHRASLLLRSLPPLETLDRVAYHCVAYALPLLTLGLVFGIAQVFGGYTGMTPRRWLLDPKTFASLGTWGLYLFYLAARLVAGWRGVRLQYILVIGLFIALGLYLIPTHTHHFM